MNLDFTELFNCALSALIEANGGSIEEALDDMGVRLDSQRAEIKDWFGWEEKFKVRCYNIDYCVEAEDVDDGHMTDKQIEAKIKKVKASLDQEVIVEVECTMQDLEDVVLDELTEETGWLINSFDYEIIND